MPVPQCLLSSIVCHRLTDTGTTEEGSSYTIFATQRLNTHILNAACAHHASSVAVDVCTALSADKCNNLPRNDVWPITDSVDDSVCWTCANSHNIPFNLNREFH